jgi:hypothetical protein
MKYLAALIVRVGLLAACGSSTPAVSHTDALACRTVYRLQQLAQIGPNTITGQQAAGALQDTAVGTTKSLDAGLTVTADEISLVGVSTTILAPLVSPCAALGITTVCR